MNGETRIVETSIITPVKPAGEDMSASQWDVFAGPSGCEAKWGFQYISRLPRRQSESAARGTRLHKYQESYLKNGLFPADHNEPLAKLAMAGWQHLPPRETVDPRLVEGDFRIPRESVTWRGQIDLLHIFRGRVWVIDHKTTGNAKYALTPTTIRENVQAQVYAWAAGQLSGLPSVDLRWIYYDTTTVKKTWAVDATIRTEDAEAFLQTRVDGPAKRAISLLRERPDPQTLPKNPASCGAYGGCPYAGVCRLDTKSALVALFGLPMKGPDTVQMPPPGFPPPGFPPPPPGPPAAPLATPSQTALGDLLARAQQAPAAPPVLPPPADLAAALASAPPLPGMLAPPAPPAPPMPPPPAAIIAPPPPEATVPVPPDAPRAEPPRGTWFRDDYGRDVYGCLHCPAWLLPEQVFGGEDKAGACPSCKSRVNQFDGGYQAIAQRFNPPALPTAAPMPPPPPALPTAAPMPPPPPPPPPPMSGPTPETTEEPPKRRGRPKGSKNTPKADTAPRVAGPTEIGNLYIGCMPDDDTAVAHFDFVAACEAIIRTKPEHATLEDWRDIEYGKGPAVLAVAARHVAFGSCDMYVSDPRDPAFVAIRGVLESFASRIVRATV